MNKVTCLGEGLATYNEVQKDFYDTIDEEIDRIEDIVIINVGRTTTVTLDGDFTVEELEVILNAFKKAEKNLYDEF